MRYASLLALVLVAGCKDDEHVVYQHGDNNRYSEPLAGQPPIEDMVRVPASADGLVKEFYIDKYEVTAGQYGHCEFRKRCDSPVYLHECGDDAVRSQSEPDRPMNCVAPREAMAYCRYRGKRLPTKAEWLHAALGDDGRAYPWGNEPPSCANAVISTKECPTTKSMNVGSRPSGASPYGAQDMVGNVSEFAFEPPQLHGDGRYVVMGGHYGNSPETLSHGLEINTQLIDTPQQGFRCAWSADMLPSSGKIRGPE